MGTLAKFAVLFGSLLVSATPTCAGTLTIVDQKPVFSDPYSSPQIERPWVPQRPNPQLVERPFADLLAAKLGFASGKAELFRYQLEDAPSSTTKFDGVFDGAGIKLKLSW